MGHRTFFLELALRSLLDETEEAVGLEFGTGEDYVKVVGADGFCYGFA